jgi:hypothetical protein
VQGYLGLRQGSEMKTGAARRKPPFSKDKRRTHRHYRVTVIYHDGEQFARVYSDRQKANNFAKRQKKSPAVKQTRIAQVGT